MYIRRTRHGMSEKTTIAYNNTITVLLHEFLREHSAKRLTLKCEPSTVYLKNYGSMNTN